MATPHAFLTRYKGILQEAGLAGQTFHNLRHSAATLLARRWVPARAAMEILGRSDIATTMNVHTHVMGNHLREVFASREAQAEADWWKVCARGLGTLCGRLRQPLANSIHRS